MTPMQSVSSAWRRYVAALILSLLAGGPAAVYAASLDGLHESDLAALAWRSPVWRARLAGWTRQDGDC